jgi:hypothetical protein
MKGKIPVGYADFCIPSDEFGGMQSIPYSLKTTRVLVCGESTIVIIFLRFLRGNIMWRELIYLFSFMLVLCPAGNVSAQLPPGWSSQDIGGPPQGGAHYESATQTWTIQADGTGIGGTADQFHYVYKPLVGDGELVARVVSLGPAVNEWSKAGVMIRETLTPGSKYVLMAVTTNTPGGNHGVTFQGRTATNGSSDDDSSGAMTAPYWVKLTRSGSTFTGYHSPDGKNWTVQYSATDPTTPTKLYIGLAVSSHVGGTLVTAVFDNGPTKAYDPDPADQAKDVTTPLVRWTAGVTAASHDVYFGTNPTPGPAEFITRYNYNMYYIPALVPGTTYYWRIDEVEGDGVTMHTGDVWSFTAAPLTAYNSNPADGAKWMAINADLSWSAGATGVKHDVYFGTDQTAVANGTGGTLKSSQQTTKTYEPGTLALDTTYYWRIDEFDSGGAKYPGAVWSFTTIGASAGIRGYYFNNMNVSGVPVLVRIDPTIDFNWGDPGSPGTAVNVDQFSARWVGVVEALYSEPYTFTSNSDDGIRVWLNDVLIIDSWIAQSPTMHSSAAINLVAGQRYGVRVEYYENTGGAVAQLFWQSPSTPRQIIPAGALQLPLTAGNPNPSNGAVDVKQMPILRWSAGEKAVKHNVYFGTDAAAVANATTGSAGIYRGQQDLKANSYVPTEAPLAWNSTYYWRIDEVNAADVWKGGVWGFTTANFIVVDDFEDYTDDVGSRIFQTWLDGWGYKEPAPGYPGNGTGSAVGYSQPPFAEKSIVHGAGQSMPLAYDNSGAAGKARYSETQREWASPQDWTPDKIGIKALTLSFYGAAANAGEQLYVALEDNAGHVKVVNYPDPEAVRVAGWQEWNIELTQFAGVNLAAVKKMYIGLGNRTSPKVGGTGTIYVDDIRVYPSRCVPSFAKPTADLSGNCVVDYADLVIMAGEWLGSGAGLVADLDRDGNVDLADYAKLADTWLEEVLWP